MRGFGLQRQRPVADQLRIAAVLLRKIGRWMPQYAHFFQQMKKVRLMSLLLFCLRKKVIKDKYIYLMV